MQLRLQEAKRIKTLTFYLLVLLPHIGDLIPEYLKSMASILSIWDQVRKHPFKLYLLRRYLMEINPKLLVIDANPLMLSIDGTEFV